jgi:hypothetical protein
VCLNAAPGTMGSVRARANMYRVSGRAIVAATRRALDDATIQVAVKGALVQNDRGSGLR